MNAAALTIAVLALGLGLAACSESPESEAKEDQPDHVWKGQVEAYDSAKDVAGKINRNLERQQEQLREIETQR